MGMMNAIVLSFALLAALVGDVLAADPITGTVSDLSASRVPGARVQLMPASEPGLTSETWTDGEGRFAIEPRGNPPWSLTISLSGFSPHTARLTEAPGRDLEIVLETSPVAEQLTVVAVREPDVMPQQRYRALDVVRTPGTQADFLRMAQTLPGVAQIDEGAGLFVRGGDVHETTVMLDGVALAHPYRFETTAGGWSGSVDAFQLEGITFETGAFPARFGDALSGVLDLRGQGAPSSRQIRGTIGLAGLSGSIAAKVSERVSLRMSGNRSWTRLLFALNRPPREYATAPEGFDLGARLYWNAGRFGRLRFNTFTQGDRIGVLESRDAFSGMLRSEGRQVFSGLLWDLQLPPFARVTIAAGHDRYRRNLDVGVLSLDTEDRTTTLRLDGLYVRDGWAVRSGVEGTPRSTATEGRAPSRGGDFGGQGGERLFRVVASTRRVGGFAEVERRFGALSVNTGVRFDRFQREAASTLGPRAAVVFRLTESQSLRLAWGRYSQGVDPAYFEEYRGASTLLPTRSRHLVLGYESGTEASPLQIRVEGYSKRYRSLPLEASGAGYSSDGFGLARGIDTFLRRTWARGQVRVNYSYLHARRRFTPADQRDRYPIPASMWRPDFEIPHTLGLVANATLTDSLTAALAWRRASGRLFTPVQNALATSTGYQAVFAEINSERLPRYERLDVSLNHARSWKGAVLIFFGSVSNLFGRRNFFEYSYSPDYSARTPVLRSAARSFYTGVSFSR